jgi:vitamin-K-epoxide reductase (warfarin-sensitive)
MTAVIILATLGVIISLYGMFVEYKVRREMNYHAACDITNTISCTKSFVSPYSKLLGISNIIICMIFYCAMLFFALLHNAAATMLLAWIGFAGALVYGYVLYFKVKALCLICTSLYIINILLVVVQYV